MSEPEPIGDSIPDALVNLLNTKELLEQRSELQAEREAKKKHILRTVRGAARKEKLRQLVAEYQEKLRQLVENAIRKRGA